MDADATITRPELPTAGATAARAGLWILAYLVLVSAPLVLVALFGPPPHGGTAARLGRAAALVAFPVLVMQVVLGSRLKPVHRPFGLDAVMLFHKGMALVAASLLVAHPLLIAWGENEWGILSLDSPWQVWLGKAALLLLLLGLLGAALRGRRVLPYQRWRLAHKSMVLVPAVAFFHAVLIGPDLQAAAPAAMWWVLGALLFGAFAWRNLFYPRIGRRRFRVSEVRPVSRGATTLSLAPDDGRLPPAWNPGQFMFLVLDLPERGREEHPFTISASPGEGGSLAVTIKKSGDFTDGIDTVRTGDRVRLDAPFGRFSHVHHQTEALVFVTGGIGITPVRSMLRQLQDDGGGPPSVLIDANRTEADIAFRRELDQLGDWIQVVHVLSEPGEDWEGPTGLVTADMIRRYAGQLLDKAHVFLCGPPPMMKSLLAELRLLGIDRNRIHHERFSL